MAGWQEWWVAAAVAAVAVWVGGVALYVGLRRRVAVLVATVQVVPWFPPGTRILVGRGPLSGGWAIDSVHPEFADRERRLLEAPEVASAISVQEMQAPALSKASPRARAFQLPKPVFPHYGALLIDESGWAETWRFR